MIEMESGIKEDILLQTMWIIVKYKAGKKKPRFPDFQW